MPQAKLPPSRREELLLKWFGIALVFGAWCYFFYADRHSSAPLFLALTGHLLIDGDRPREERSWLNWTSRTSLLLIVSFGVTTFLLPSDAGLQWTIGAWVSISAMLETAFLLVNRPKLLQLSLR